MVRHGNIGLAELVKADPGLPRNNPSRSYWMQPLHCLSGHQSKVLQTTADIVIIGSGITGAVTAKTILQRHPEYTVSVLEARDVCSGATGRNGGHLVAYGGAIYSGLKQAFGREMASKILAFTFDNVDKTTKLIKENASQDDALDNGYRLVTRYRSFADNISYQEAQNSVAEFERDNPQWAGLYRFVGGDEAATAYGIYHVAGVCIFTAAALSPYRLVTAIYKHLVQVYGQSRFFLETNTPVLSVSQQPTTSHPYVVVTPRGIIQASQVVHCTNGYAGHLLPELRGPLYPFRGCMTVQDLGKSLPNRGNSASWSLHHRPKINRGRSATGTHYLQQDCNSGFFYFGGQEEAAGDMVTADDAQVPTNSVHYLRQTLLRLFGLDADMKTTGHTVSAWTGVMGFTADGLPLVGQLPEAITGRRGHGEWIAAGFNGMGMSMCVASGEAVGRMMLGEDVDSVPAACLVTPARLRDCLTIETSIRKLGAMFLPPATPQSRL